MSILLADTAYVQSVGSFQQFSLSVDPQLVDFICNATDGATGKLPGNTDWTGTIQCLGLIPQILPGTDFAFEGIFEEVGVSTDIGVEAPSAYCESVSYSIPVETGGPIVQTINFSADSALTRSAGTGTGTETTTLPDYASLDATRLELRHAVASGSPSFISTQNVRTINFELSQPGNAYVDAGQWKRTAGTIAASLSYDFFADSALAEPWLVEGNDYNVQLWNTVDTQSMWTFWFMTYGPTSNLLANRETREPIGATGNFTHTAISDIASVATKGKIRYYDGTSVQTFWS